MKSYGLGRVVDTLAEFQEQIVAAVRDTGKAGELTLKLKFKRSGQNGMIVDPTITPKIPRQPIQAVEMYADDNNQLHEENPDQMTFDKDVIKPDFKKTVNQV